MSVSPGSPVYLSDLVSLCSECGVTVEGLDCLAEGPSASVRQVITLAYPESYEYYLNGGLPVCSSSTIDVAGGLPACSGDDGSSNAILIKAGSYGEFGGCAVLELDTFSTYSASIASNSSYCACPLSIPQQGQPISPDTAAFDTSLLMRAFNSGLATSGAHIDEEKTKTGSQSFSYLGQTVTVNNLITELTIVYDGTVRPRIKKSYYEEITKAVLEKGGKGDIATKVEHGAYNQTIVMKPWFDGGGNQGVYARMSEGASWYGDITGPMFLCILGNGMTETIECTGVSNTAGEDPFAKNAVDVIGGTCVPSKGGGSACNPGGCIASASLSTVKSGYNGQLGNTKASGCGLGEYAVHAAWYNQMINIAKWIDEYKVICGGAQGVSGGGAGGWWHGYYDKELPSTYSEGYIQYKPVTSVEPPALDGFIEGGCSIGQMVDAASEKQKPWKVSPSGNGLYRIDGASGGATMTATVLSNFGPSAGDPKELPDGNYEQALEWACGASMWAHVLCGNTASLTVTAADGDPDVGSFEVHAKYASFPPDNGAGSADGAVGGTIDLGSIKTSSDRAYIHVVFTISFVPADTEAKNYAYLVGKMPTKFTATLTAT